MSARTPSRYEEDLGARTAETAFEITVATMAVSGESTKRISEKLERDEREVKKVLAKSGVRRYMGGLKDRIEAKLVDEAPGVEVIRRITAEAAKAVEVLSAIQADEALHPRDRINAAKVLMSYSPELRVVREKSGDGESEKHLHLHLAPKQVEWMKRAMRETGNERLAGLIDKSQEPGMEQ